MQSDLSPNKFYLKCENNINLLSSSIFAMLVKTWHKMQVLHSTKQFASLEWNQSSATILIRICTEISTDRNKNNLLFTANPTKNIHYNSIELRVSIVASIASAPCKTKPLPRAVVKIRVPRRPSAVESERQLLVMLVLLAPQPKGLEHRFWIWPANVGKKRMKYYSRNSKLPL